MAARCKGARSRKAGDAAYTAFRPRFGPTQVVELTVNSSAKPSHRHALRRAAQIRPSGAERPRANVRPKRGWTSMRSSVVGVDGHRWAQPRQPSRRSASTPTSGLSSVHRQHHRSGGSTACCVQTAPAGETLVVKRVAADQEPAPYVATERSPRSVRSRAMSAWRYSARAAAGRRCRMRRGRLIRWRIGTSRRFSVCTIWPVRQ
jgi:hypothetical protein